MVHYLQIMPVMKIIYTFYKSQLNMVFVPSGQIDWQKKIIKSSGKYQIPLKMQFETLVYIRNQII